MPKPKWRTTNRPMILFKTRTMTSLIASIFTSSAVPGIYYSPKDLTSSYIDNPGTVLVATPGSGVPDSAIAFKLDKSRGATNSAGAGIHSSQATAAARPKLSARVNLIRSSEKMGTLWSSNSTAGKAPIITEDYAVGPDGATLCSRIQLPACPTNAEYSRILYAMGTGTGGANCSSTVKIKGTSAGGTLQISFVTNFGTTGSQMVVFTNTGWTEFKLENKATSGAAESFLVGFNGAAGPWAAVDFLIANASLVTGPIASYQKIAGDTYDIVNRTIFNRLDGADDGMSVSFVAGTLGNNMDILVAAMRTTDANFILFSSAATGGKYVGFVSTAITAAADNSGTPTTWINGVQVPGGTATTAAQLKAAWPLGVWVILELRNVDMSLWAGFFTSMQAGLFAPVNVGEVLVVPSFSIADRNFARTEMGKTVGLVL